MWGDCHGEIKIKVKNLMFFVKKLLTNVKVEGIVCLTINIKNLFFIVRFLARVYAVINFL